MAIRNLLQNQNQLKCCTKCDIMSEKWTFLSWKWSDLHSVNGILKLETSSTDSHISDSLPKRTGPLIETLGYKDYHNHSVLFQAKIGMFAKNWSYRVDMPIAPCRFDSKQSVQHWFVWRSSSAHKICRRLLASVYDLLENHFYFAETKGVTHEWKKLPKQDANIASEGTVITHNEQIVYTGAQNSQ